MDAHPPTDQESRVASYDASNSDVFIFARRQSGTLLSRMGHDIKIRAGTFQIDADIEQDGITAHFDADSLQPVDAIKWEDKEETGELSSGDRHEIKQRMDKLVLEVEEFPDIDFRSTDVSETDDGWHVVGELDLHGESHQIEFDIRRKGDRARVETTIDHTDFGIEPYSAMLGSLKVDPELLIVVETPLDT